MREEVKAASTDSHAAVADRLIKLLGKAFDALGGGIESSDYRVGRSFGTIGRDEASILQGGDVLLQASHPVHRFNQLVGHHQRCHDGQACIADLSKLAA